MSLSCPLEPQRSILFRIKLIPLHILSFCSRFFISSFRSLPTQLWIRGTIFMGGKIWPILLSQIALIKETRVIHSVAPTQVLPDVPGKRKAPVRTKCCARQNNMAARSEEYTSELQS